MRRHIFIPVFVFVLLLAGCTLPGGGNGECPDTEYLVCGADGVTYQNPCFASKAGTTVAQEGPCSSGNCTDSDGGKDIFVSSTVLSGGTYESDYCIDASTVVEYFCLGSNSSSEEIPCPAGYSCDNGACKVLPCVDSDGGMVPGTKGTASSGPDSGTDSCIDESTLTEFYCKNGQVSSEEIDCPANTHCSGGACTEFECTDSDGGQEPDEAGTVELGAVSKSDSCADSDTVKEYYCEAGEIESTNIDCASGEVCSGGECVSEPSCSDSDGGQDRYEQGTTSYLEESYTDACYSADTVLEYYCSGNSIKSVRLICTEGYTCYQGACWEIECTEKDLDEDEHFYVFGSISSITLYVDDDDGPDTVGIEDDYYLVLNSVEVDPDNESKGTATFTLYDEDGKVCKEEIDLDDEDTPLGEDGDFCDEGVDIDVKSVNYDAESVEISGDLVYLQVYSREGTVTDCEDEDSEIEETSYFYPYLSDDEVYLLGAKYDVDVDEDEETVSIEDVEDDIEDGDEAEVEDVELEGIGIEDGDYEFSFEFSDDGLVSWTVERT